MTDVYDTEITHGEIEPIDAGYVWIDFADQAHRVYYETAGDGEVPLVCLHTAGADARQWRHVLNDEDVLNAYTVYTFDLPWHGKSFPPVEVDWLNEEYQLTTDAYAGFIMEFIRTFELDNPVVMGCSMGGAIVLELAAEYAEELTAVIGLESTAFAPTRDIGFFDDPEVNQEVVRAEWVSGLQAPQSPDQYTRESWWVYSQGGPGIYMGDLHFYATDWDGREKIETIDTDDCGVYLFTGEYDFSATPDDTRRVAEKIEGAHLEIMDEIGHFPMVENPARFKEYVGPTLEHLETD